MKRWDPATVEGATAWMESADDGEWLSRDTVLCALATCGLELDEGLALVLQVLGISQEEYQEEVDRNHPGPDPVEREHTNQAWLDETGGES